MLKRSIFCTIFERYNAFQKELFNQWKVWSERGTNSGKLLYFITVYLKTLVCVFIVVCTVWCISSWRSASHGPSSPVCDPCSWYIYPIKYLIKFTEQEFSHKKGRCRINLWAHLSLSKFRRCLKNYFCLSPYKYIVRKRTEKEELGINNENYNSF